MAPIKAHLLFLPNRGFHMPRFLKDDSGAYDLNAVSAVTRNKDGMAILQLEGGQTAVTATPYQEAVTGWLDFVENPENEFDGPLEDPS
jgi:hypothetical protein